LSAQERKKETYQTHVLSEVYPLVRYKQDVSFYVINNTVCLQSVNAALLWQHTV